LVNYLMLLGWSPGGDQEVLPFMKAVEKFSIKKINKTAAQFDMEKLRWVNAQYIKVRDMAALTDMLIPLLKEEGRIGEVFDRKWLENVVSLYKSRMSTLREFIERADYLFVRDFQISAEARASGLNVNLSGEFGLLAERLKKAENFDPATTEKIFRDLVTELGIKSGDLVHPVRVALTGHSIGPGLFETMDVLGKEKTVMRLRSTFVK
jgi:glutamyl-tRNA synthetase